MQQKRPWRVKFKALAGQQLVVHLFITRVSL